MFICFLGRAYTGYNVDQLKNMIYNIQSKQLGSWEGRIRSAPLMFVADKDPRMFLQFDVSFSTPGEIGLQRMLGWSHPDLEFLCKSGAVNAFIDGTFRVVPKGFFQLLMIMIYSKAHDTYVPLFHILLPNKAESTYKRALEEVALATNNEFKPNKKCYL